MDATDNASVNLIDVGETKADEDLVSFDMRPEKVEQTPVISLEPPLRDSAPSFNSVLGSPSKTRPASVIATKNTRKRMEDRHVVLHDLKAYLPSALQDKIDSDEHVSYYAVFDGHAGTDAAAHAAAHLHEMVIESSCYPDNILAAFSEAFVKCDNDFVTMSKKSGTTAICSLIKENTIFTAWLGDSQAILVRGGMPVKIVEAHKPNRDDERARIEALGGTIMHWGTWRVNGQLAVSRAIGDGEYKPFICADPDITTTVNEGNDEFLILACDGLWDMITPEEATDIVLQHLDENKLNGGDIENLSARLASAAKDKGSGDNITIIVIFIKTVDEVIALGRRKLPEQFQSDNSSLSSTCQYVMNGTATRASLEPSTDKPDFTSPNVSFGNLEGGQMFSPDPFGSVDNGFNLSSEQFDNKIDDKRFSNESQPRASDENMNNGSQMDELLKQQSIAKVEDLFKMLDREDSSPTPDEEDARPLEEILAAARNQPQDEVDGVEDDDDSSDDEIVDFGACGKLNQEQGIAEDGGNKNLEEVLKLNENSLSEEQEETDNFSEDKNAFSEAQQQKKSFQEPSMDPCEQVTVKETGPQEYSTIVPPVQEMPSFQQPVIEIVDPMTCSMVKEEIEQEPTEVKTNGNVDLVSFDSNEPEGFMLKTPGENGGELLAEFTPDKEPETSVDTGDDVITPVKAEDDVMAPVVSGVASLTIPDLEITPATPVKERSPAPSPRATKEDQNESKQEVSVEKEKVKEITKEKDIKSATPKKTPVANAKTAASKPGVKATPSKTGPSKPAVSKPASSTRPTTTRTTPSARTTTSTRPTTTAASRTKPAEDNKSTKSGSTTSSTGSANVRATPRSSTAAKPLERKPMPTKPESTVRKPAVPRTDVTKTKAEPTKDKLPPKRPTSSTLPKTSAGTSSISRQTSSASSASSSRPRPGSAATKPGSASATRPSAVSRTTGEEVKKPTTSRLTSSRASTSSLRSSSSTTSATAAKAPGTATKPSTLRRTTSATTTRASINSTTAVKPSAAAERVKAARAAAMSKPGPKPRSKTSTTNLKKLDSKEGSPAPSNPEEEKINGHSENKEALTNEIVETGDNSNKVEVDASPHTNGSTQAINGIEETNQSEC